jgi:hypothetical protein
MDTEYSTEEEKAAKAAEAVGHGRNMLPTDQDLRECVEFFLQTPVFEHFDVKKDPLNNIIMRCESRLIKRPGLLTHNPLFRLKIEAFIAGFSLERQHVRKDDKQKSRKQLAAEADEKRDERKKRLAKIVKGKVKGPPRDVNKPAYKGVCSREKRYSILLGNAQSASSVRSITTSVSVISSDASLTKPRRALNTAYDGASKRRSSQVLGESTNARSRDNLKVKSLGRPANRWTEVTRTSRLPRLPPREGANITQSTKGPRRHSVVEEAIDKMVVVKPTSAASSPMKGRLYRFILGKKRQRH